MLYKSCVDVRSSDGSAVLTEDSGVLSLGSLDRSSLRLLCSQTHCIYKKTIKMTVECWGSAFTYRETISDQKNNSK